MIPVPLGDGQFLHLEKKRVLILIEWIWVYIGSGLRIAIVHARWNTAIIENLVAGAKKSLFAAGVKEENITIQTVPGSYELPIGVQRYVQTPSIHFNL